MHQPGRVSTLGVFDMVSLRLADSFGIDALHMAGCGTVASHMGLPDAGLATCSDMVDRVTAMAGMASTPLTACADTGYGGLLNLRHTLRGYEAAGACDIQLKVQAFPKGHIPGRQAPPQWPTVHKIRIAIISRTSKYFWIITRTDVRSTLELAEALRQAESIAGADIFKVAGCARVQRPTCTVSGRWAVLQRTGTGLF